MYLNILVSFSSLVALLFLCSSNGLATINQIQNQSPAIESGFVQIVKEGHEMHIEERMKELEKTRCVVSTVHHLNLANHGA